MVSREWGDGREGSRGMVNQMPEGNWILGKLVDFFFYLRKRLNSNIYPWTHKGDLNEK